MYREDRFERKLRQETARCHEKVHRPGALPGCPVCVMLEKDALLIIGPDVSL